ncbi:MAG: CpaE family protein [Bryobacteraceae bacterium]
MYNHKFNCTIISPNPPVVDTYSRELTRSSSIASIDCLQDYPSDEILTRMLRLNAMDLLIIDCADSSRALQIIEGVHRKNPNIEILAICEEHVKNLSSLMRAGVRDYVPADAHLDAVRDTLVSSIESLRGRPRRTGAGGDIVAFLPSKPGSGASTVAANTALTASKSAATRVLLVDLDRDAPVQAFLNRLRPEHFLQEAFANSHQMDGDLWARLASQRDALDVLPADADGSTGPESGRVQELLNFLRRVYDLTCVDLPGALDPCSVEVLLEAKRVYLVCTQELASIHIALRKVDRLRRLGLGKEIRVVLNRYVAGHVMTPDRVADLIGLPVELTIPNSYALATASAEKGMPVDPFSPLGKSYTKLARIALDGRIEIPRKQRKFLEFVFQAFVRPQATSA